MRLAAVVRSHLMKTAATWRSVVAEGGSACRCWRGYLRATALLTAQGDTHLARRSGAALFSSRKAD